MDMNEEHLLPAHGLTPPMYDVRNRSWRKTPFRRHTHAVEIEQEVSRLINDDSNAVAVTCALLSEHDGALGIGGADDLAQDEAETASIGAAADEVHADDDSDAGEEINMADLFGDESGLSSEMSAAEEAEPDVEPFPPAEGDVEEAKEKDEESDGEAEASNEENQPSGTQDEDAAARRSRRRRSRAKRADEAEDGGEDDEAAARSAEARAAAEREQRRQLWMASIEQLRAELQQLRNRNAVLETQLASAQSTIVRQHLRTRIAMAIEEQLQKESQLQMLEAEDSEFFGELAAGGAGGVAGDGDADGGGRHDGHHGAGNV